MNRNLVWQNIWNKKGEDKDQPLHILDGYDLLTSDEFDNLVKKVISPLTLRGSESICECGCGAGAFLLSLLKLYPNLKVTGVDYSSTLLERARESINGDFILSDITDLSLLPTASFDHTMSFGVFFYLSSEDAARRAVTEMLRITKPGGCVYIGEIPDQSKFSHAEEIRSQSHRSVHHVSPLNPDHLYFNKSFFLDFADQNSVNVVIVDHTELDLKEYKAALYRFSVYLTKLI